MGQVIDAYTRITADAEFREIGRQRELARHNEASATVKSGENRPYRIPRTRFVLGGINP